MNKGYTCTICGKRHDELPMDFAFNAPHYWNEALAEKHPDKYHLSSDRCIVDKNDYFIRGVIEIPIIDSKKNFHYGVWVSLSEKNFRRYNEVYGTKKELEEEPYFGWLSNQILGYPNTLEIKTLVHLQGNSLRPKIELDHTNPHPLCQEQHSGITMHRAHEIINTLDSKI